MFGYLGKVLFFMILAQPFEIGMYLLGFPTWLVFTIWIALGVIGRETLGRKIESIDRRDREAS